MTETRETLEARKRDLFTAIRTLDADYGDGTLDEAAYRSMRERYEREAADTLAQLDALGPAGQGATTARRPARRLTTWLTLLIIAGIIVIILLGALQRRTEDAALSRISAQSVTPTPTSKALAKAMRAVRKDPRSAAAQIALGNALLNLGETSQADVRYREAMQLEPSDPRGPTLHAMILGGRSQRAQALQLLGDVERQHPGYARAWLLDGLLASHTRATYPRAIHAWRQFLTLQPRSPLAPQVRKWIASTQKAERKQR
jgi:cytochrome c-type biogenesis protein CcmH/NrfG